MAQVAQPSTCYDVVLALSQTEHKPGESFSSLVVLKKQRNIVQNISVAENTIQQVTACNTFESKMAMKNSTAVIEIKEETLFSFDSNSASTFLFLSHRQTVQRGDMRFRIIWTARDD